MLQELLGTDTFEFLARFFMAGWIFLSARSWWVRGERPRPNEVIFEAVALSLLNQLLALLTIRHMAQEWLDISAPALLVLEVLVQPAILGLLTGWLADGNFLPYGLRRLLMPSIKPVTQAYEFAFDQIAAPGFVILTYGDGRVIYGFFGELSLASESDAESGGIYLESLYVLGESGEWEPAEPPRSAWVSRHGLDSIEFLSRKESQNG